ncbi:hypothetical protein RJ53_10145 [Methanocalculus chunghsingensis]|uniref:Plasmid stabilization system n=2 Tax=Methanocalculus chunghsingensis TaxID=156457 RepID=A0A8J7W8R1_9EURY|nr:hypothetical protein [Methanocalculus chunghsingensis]MBR1369816.1 hypothetical protein [Methanocalculus chunghsingensis]
MRIEIERAVCEYVLGLPLKSRRIILRHLRTLEALGSLTGASGIERLGGDIYRMHVSRTYTIIFRICPDQSRIRVVEILPIDLAHKRYFRYR